MWEIALTIIAVGIFIVLLSVAGAIPQWIAPRPHEQLERIENKLDELLKRDGKE